MSPIGGARASVKHQLESTAHRLTERHGALLRLLRAALTTDPETPLQGHEARFELLLILEELDSRPPVSQALQCFDFADQDPKVTQAYQQAISAARSLISQEAALKARLDELYLAAYGASAK